MRFSFAALQCCLFLRCCLLLSASLLLCPGPSPAQTPHPLAPTLAETLARTVPPAPGVILSLDADTVKLLPNTSLPNVRSAADIADAYGRLAYRFGSVTAIAPPLMVVLGTPPETPDPYSGIPPGDVLKLLAGTLTSEQWKALLGEQGLGLSDMVAPKQTALFLALFPSNTFKVQWDRPGEPNRDEDIQDLSAQIPQARLRLGQRVNLGLPVVGHPNTHSFGMDFEPEGAPKHYVQVGGSEADADFVDGARVRADLPNAPKHGDLALDAPALQAAVSTAGVQTLGQLLLRIGRACHTEIYPDARIEGKRLTVLGNSAASAADLLRAVALCVTGTYRKVGPAFVLCDNIVGIGTRRQLWADFEQRAADLRANVLDQAGDAILTKHTLDDVPTQGELLGLTSAQVAAFHKQHANDAANHRMPSGNMMGVDLPMAQLTPAQQEVARHTVDYYSRNPPDDQITTDGVIMVQSEVTLQVVLPSLDGPIDMQYNLFGLFQPSARAFNRQIEQADTRGRDFQAQWDAQRKQAHSLSLPSLLQTPKHRAVLANPQTAAEADALVASAKALGLNEIWLDAFSGGTAHTEALTEALKATNGSGLRVFAAFDLLRWGPDAPPEAQDLSLRGDTSAADAVRQAQARAAESVRYGGTMGIPRALPPQPLLVSPFSPLVRQRLLDTVHDISRLPGLAGMAWQETVSPGYLPVSRMITLGAPAPLGYGEAARLLFLRRAHTDPVDLFPNEYRQGHADTRLPAFDNFNLDRSLWQRWGEFRRAENLAFLHALRAVVAPGQAVVIAARGPADRDPEQGPSWYGTWDNPARPPTDRDEFASGEAWQNDQTQARAQSRLTFSPVRVPPWLPSLPEKYRVEMLDEVKQQMHEAFTPGHGPVWDGYVLDAIMPLFASHRGPAPSADPLALLAAPPAASDKPSSPAPQSSKIAL